MPARQLGLGEQTLPTRDADALDVEVHSDDKGRVRIPAVIGLRLPLHFLHRVES